MSRNAVTAAQALRVLQSTFLVFLADGRYAEAEMWLGTVALKANTEGDFGTRDAARLLLGISYQQRGDRRNAGRILKQLRRSADLVIAARASVHLAKVYSQLGAHRLVLHAGDVALQRLRNAQGAGLMTAQEAEQLAMPILWRQGVSAELSGERQVGRKLLSQHRDMGAQSPYQLANASACDAILYGAGITTGSATKVHDGLSQAQQLYIGAPEDATTGFAFRDKAFIGMVLLDAVSDLRTKRRFGALVKLHIVRHFMRASDILAQSEGFAEMIGPISVRYPEVFELLTVPETTYDQWVDRLSHRDLYVEARLVATDTIRALETAGPSLYSAVIAPVQGLDGGQAKHHFLGQQESERMKPDKRRVFVIYGRNDRPRRAVCELLRAVGLQPIEWSQAVELTGKGAPFVGEVIERAFDVAQAAVVILTGDDEARLRTEFRKESDPPYEADLQPQPRPNVLFEAGMAMGRYPDRTVLIEFGRLRPFSDVSGRHMIKAVDSVQTRKEIVQRLVTAGCQADTTGNDWLTAGDWMNAV